MSEPNAAAMDLDEAGREWRSALVPSKLTAIEARLVRQRITQMFMQFAAGDGPDPPREQLDEVTRLEQIADDQRLIEEAILNRVFGVTR